MEWTGLARDRLLTRRGGLLESYQITAVRLDMALSDASAFTPSFAHHYNNYLTPLCSLLPRVSGYLSIQSYFKCSNSDPTKKRAHLSGVLEELQSLIVCLTDLKILLAWHLHSSQKSICLYSRSAGTSKFPISNTNKTVHSHLFLGGQAQYSP